MTTICDFCYTINDLAKNLILMIVAAGTVALNISYDRLLMVVFLTMKKLAPSKKYTHFQTRLLKPCPIKVPL